MVRSDNTLAFDKMNQISHDNSPSLFEGDARIGGPGKGVYQPDGMWSDGWVDVGRGWADSR